MNTSVLMSVYKNDHPVWLKESLESIFNQTRPANQVVLVQDGPISTELQNVINEYSSIHGELSIIKLENNLGLGLALNEGLKHCKHEIIIRMDSDDICHPKRFEKLIDIFNQFPKVDAVSSWIDEFIDSIDNIINTRKLPEYPYELSVFAQSRSPLNHAATAFKKSSIIMAGGYQHFKLFEDYYLWSRMLKGGATIYNIPESLLYVRVSKDMYARRGGWEYAKNSVKFLKTLKRMQFISNWQLIKMSCIRTIVCLMPNGMRKWVYQHFLR